MAVNPDDVQAISIATVQLYREAELELLRLIARYLSQGMDAPTWAEERLAAVTKLRQAAQQVLGELETTTAPLVAEHVAEAYRAGYGAALTAVELGRLAPDVAGRVVTRTAAMESLAAAVVRDIGVRHRNVLRDVVDVYRAVVTQASSLSIAGGLTRRQASQEAYARFVDRGVTGFTDRAGRRWRLSSYVEMALRTVTARAAQQGQEDRQVSLGLDLLLISDSPGECIKCRPWEHKVLSITGAHRGRVQLPSVVDGTLVTVDVAGSVVEARAAGLWHPNCTHAGRAFLPGATVIPEGETADPEHNKAKERQREIERAIRRWKERDAAALTPDAKAKARAKVRAWQQEMRNHLNANPRLKRLPYREQIGGGNHPPKTRNTSTPKPPPPTPSTRKPGRDIESQARQRINDLQIAATEREEYGDPGLTELIRMQPGWGDPARVMSPADMDRAISEGWVQMWRGVTDAESPEPITATQVAEQVRTGDWKAGVGIYGNGMYTSTRRTTARVYLGEWPASEGSLLVYDGDNWGPPPTYEWLGSFATNSSGGTPGVLMRMALDPQARVANYSILAAEHREWLATQADAPQAWQIHMSDLGWYAAMRGYDAIRVQSGLGTNDGAPYPAGVASRTEADQYIILNRSVLIMEAP